MASKSHIVVDNYLAVGTPLLSRRLPCTEIAAATGTTLGIVGFGFHLQKLPLKFDFPILRHTAYRLWLKPELPLVEANSNSETERKLWNFGKNLQVEAIKFHEGEMLREKEGNHGGLWRNHLIEKSACFEVVCWCCCHFFRPHSYRFFWNFQPYPTEKD